MLGGGFGSTPFGGAQQTPGFGSAAPNAFGTTNTSTRHRESHARTIASPTRAPTCTGPLLSATHAPTCASRASATAVAYAERQCLVSLRPPAVSAPAALGAPRPPRATWALARRRQHNVCESAHADGGPVWPADTRVIGGARGVRCWVAVRAATGFGQASSFGGFGARPPSTPGFGSTQTFGGTRRGRDRSEHGAGRARAANPSSAAPPPPSLSPFATPTPGTSAFGTAPNTGALGGGMGGFGSTGLGGTTSAFGTAAPNSGGLFGSAQAPTMGGAVQSTGAFGTVGAPGTPNAPCIRYNGAALVQF